MTRGFGRFLRRNTLALLALFLALGGTSYAAAALINGSHIKPHTIAKNRLTRKAIKQLRGNRGPRGLAGARGPTGNQGTRGATGPEGLGGSILTYDAKASASTTPTVLGTLLADTLGATCTIPAAGAATLTVYLETSDGSWNDGYSFVTNDNGTVRSDARKIVFPPGTLSSLVSIDARTASSGGNESNGQLEFVQLAPSPGHIIWHEQAQTNSGQTCHLSVMGIPTSISSVSGSADAHTVRSRLPLNLTR